MTQPAYHITHWDKLYETWETRKIRTLTYYAKPNKLVGEGIGLTLAEPDRAALLGTWAMIEALASTCERDHRGWLVRNGTPMTAQRMAALTRFEPKDFERALAHFSRPEVGWLELLDWPPKTGKDRTPAGDSPDSKHEPEKDRTPAGDSPDSARKRERGKIGDQREREGERGAPALPPALAVVLEWGASNRIDAEFLKEKHAETTERAGWTVRGQPVDWQARFKRFWEGDDGREFREQKKPARPGAAKKTGGLSLAHMRAATEQANQP
jgi:hypothetical protein